LRFKAFYLLTDGPLRPMDDFRGGRHPPGLGDGDERAE
jgi:hypothetical protein